MRLIDENTPFFSRELIGFWRLVSLCVGLVILVLGSVFLPSEDWDLGICFAMGLPVYVLAPWVFRQVYYFRWKWLVSAAFAMWFSIDGTYSLYWHLRGFEHLEQFRSANFAYCTPIFWMAGFVWNLDFKHFNFHLSVDFNFTRRKALRWFARLVCAAILVYAITHLVRTACAFSDHKGSCEAAACACATNHLGVFLSSVIFALQGETTGYEGA